jgi:benzoate-CoA ligase
MASASENELGVEFNLAQYLIELDSGHPAKTDCIDDLDTLSYDELGIRIRKLTFELPGLCIRREERALLLMQDNNDWSVSLSRSGIFDRGIYLT